MTSSALTPRDVLTPEALAMIQRIAELGSFAAAARATGQVPSALSYRVRQIEEALDVLLFDRSARQARPTEAGVELLREGARLLQDIDAVAHRVRRVATGWEPQLTLSVDGIISPHTLLELVDAFYAMKPPTRLKLRDGIMTGTLEALTSGRADLAIGVSVASNNVAGLQQGTLGDVLFIYVVAPHHPLATAPEPISDATLQQHRAVAVADTVQRGRALTFGLLSGQDVFTVGSMQAKLDAQLRGLGGGNLPLCMAQPYIETGRLVVKKTERAVRQVAIHYAWRSGKSVTQGKALQWWLQQLESPATRHALLERHRGL